LAQASAVKEGLCPEAVRTMSPTIEPNVVLMGHKDRQTTHDSQESFTSENSDETMADMEVRLREQLQQMRKRNAAVEMEKAEAKARSLLLEDQVKNLSSLLSETTEELKELRGSSKESDTRSKQPDTAQPGTLAAEVTRLQARVTEELSLRKTAQYEVIEKSKLLCNLQSELVEKEAVISKLQMELTLLRATTGSTAAPGPEMSPSASPPSPELRLRRFSNPAAPKAASLLLPHGGIHADRAAAPIQKAPSFSPSSRSPGSVEVKAAPKAAATKPAPTSTSAGSIRAPLAGSMSPSPLPSPMPAQAAGTNPTMTAAQPQQAVRFMRESTSPVVRQYRTQRPGAASACLARPAARIL